MALMFEPGLQEVDLGRAPNSVCPFNDDQLAAKLRQVHALQNYSMVSLMAPLAISWPGPGDSSPPVSSASAAPRWAMLHPPRSGQTPGSFFRTLPRSVPGRF